MPGPDQAAEPIVAQIGSMRLIVHARRLRGTKTLVQAAQLCGLNRDELSRIERGETKQIRFETLAKILNGYQCTLTDLVEVDTEPEAPVRPLYAGALSALQSGALTATAGQRRAVRRNTDDDVLAVDEESRFAASEPEPVRHRRRPVGIAQP